MPLMSNADTSHAVFSDGMLNAYWETTDNCFFDYTSSLSRSQRPNTSLISVYSESQAGNVVYLHAHDALLSGQPHENI